MAEAKKEDIYLGDWYRNAIAPHGVNLDGVTYKKEMCPKAEEYASMTFNLPNHPGISLCDAERVVSFLNRWIKKT